MKAGDVVKVARRNLWLGTDGIPGLKKMTIGILLKRIYCGYDPANSSWEVMVDGRVEVINQGSLCQM